MSVRVDLGGRRIIKKIFFKQKTAYEIASGDWSSDVCSSDLSSGHDLTVREFEPRIELCTDGVEPAWDSVPLLCPSPTCAHSLPLKVSK